MKPVILTNGEKLTWEFALELKKAGLAKFHFHVDSFQERPGWADKTEAEMNKLREHYADLVWQLGGIQCGYNVTIYRSTLKYLPDIVDWCRANIHKVQHISLIAFRAIPLQDGIDYLVNGKKIDPSILQNSTAALEEINITTDEMYGILEEHFGDIHPCAYLGGTTSPRSYKYLIIARIGSKKIIYGVLGAKTIELVQIFYHLFKRRYCAFLKNPVVGKRVFLLASFDKQIRRAAVFFLKNSLKNPGRLLDKIYAQTIHLQQPNEILDGEANLCDGCANMMIYKGKLINSCRLDEYRMFGSLITAQQVDKITNESVSDHQGSE